MQTEDPVISVIVPAKNEEKYISKCLDSLSAQDTKVPFEIIVVDNMSNDNTFDLAVKKGVKTVRFDGRTPAAVRNYGANLAKGQIYAFIDGDCEAPAQWLNNNFKLLSELDCVGAVGGPCFTPVDSNIFVRAWSPTSYSGKGVFTDSLPGANMIVKKDVFDLVEGFSEYLITAEDDEICKKIRGENYKIYFDSDSFVIHYGYPKNFKEYFLKSIWHGKSQLRAHGFFGDKMVFLTYMWVLSLFIFLISFIINLKFISIISFLLVVLLPIMLCKVRLKNLTLKKKMNFFPLVYLISITVLSGRFVGMLEGLFTRGIENNIFNNQ